MLGTCKFIILLYPPTNYVRCILYRGNNVVLNVNVIGTHSHMRHFANVYDSERCIKRICLATM